MELKVYSIDAEYLSKLPDGTGVVQVGPPLIIDIPDGWFDKIPYSHPDPVGINLDDCESHLGMKRNSLFEQRIKTIPDEIRKAVSIAFEELDRIHEIQASKDIKKSYNRN